MTALENYSDQCLEMISKLLQHMDKATIITSDQMKAVRHCTLYHYCILISFSVFQGLRRIYDDMTEIVLDIPNGYVYLTKLVEKGEQYSFLPLEVVNELPQR